GDAFPSASNARARVAALGPVAPALRSLVVQPGQRIDVPQQGSFERAAEFALACDPTEQPEMNCLVGGSYPAPSAQLHLPGPGNGLSFVVDELLPDAASEPMDVTVRFAGGPELALMKIGDRDTFLDERAAEVKSLGARSGASLDVRLRVGVDRGRDGW